MRNNQDKAEKYIEQFAKTCNILTFQKPEPLKTKNRPFESYGVDLLPPLRRGIELESILLKKILKHNITKSIYKVEGRFSLRSKGYKLYSHNHKLPKNNIDKEQNLLSKYLAERLFSPKNILDFNAVNFDIPKIFRAKSRCLGKVSIDYCFIDLLIDSNLIDIKTDCNIKGLKKYLKQVIIQSVMYSSFLKTNKTYPDYFSKSEVKMIDMPIDTVSIYYWRTNELFTWNLEGLISKVHYQKLVNTYALLQPTHSTELREIMRQNLFSK